MKSNSTKLRMFNTVLRLSTVGSKFFILFYLAQTITAKEVGQFSLLMATVVLLILLLGGDFYTYANRELMQQRASLNKTVLNHICFLLPVYLLAAVVIFFIPMEYIAAQSYFLIFFIVVLEQITLEGARYLIALQKPVLASISMFLRFPAWVTLYVLITQLWTFENNIQLILILWIVFDILALIFIANILVKEENFSLSRVDFNFNWITNGLKFSAIFFLSTMISRALFSIDKFIVEAVGSLSEVGVYAVYIGIANSIALLVDTLLVVFIYPKMVHSYNKDWILYKKYSHNLFWGSLGISIASALLLFVILPFLFEYMKNPLYSSNINILWILIVGFCINNIGIKAYYELYAAQKEKYLLTCNFISVIIFAMFCYLLSSLYGVIGIAASLTIALTSLTCLKIIFAKIHTGKSNEKTAIC